MFLEVLYYILFFPFITVSLVNSYYLYILYKYIKEQKYNQQLNTTLILYENMVDKQWILLKNRYKCLEKQYIQLDKKELNNENLLEDNKKRLQRLGFDILIDKKDNSITLNYNLKMTQNLHRKACYYNIENKINKEEEDTC
jgi:hypothetical protein